MSQQLPFLLLAGWLAVTATAGSGAASSSVVAAVPAADPDPVLEGAWSLVPAVQVDSRGVFLDQLLEAGPRRDLPHVRVAAAPVFGAAATLSREQVAAALRDALPGLTAVEWEGPESVQVSRRSRSLEEHELRWLLTAAAQEHLDESRGEVELRLARAWTPLVVPDEPLSVRLLDLPRGGLRANLLLRFDLLAGEERIGGWQLSVQASLWMDLPVARSALQRGQRLIEADVAVERMDALSLRDPLPLDALANEHLELAQYVRPGQPLLARAVRLRPLIRRGGMVEGLIVDGLMVISLKVEALEDAVPGQMLRVRNPRTRREFRARVQDEQTVLLFL